MTTDPHNRYLLMEATVAREVPTQDGGGRGAR